MKAAVCEAFGKPLVIKDVPEPSVGPDEVLIRMKGCGVCHSDLHLVDGDWADWGTPLPIIPGHEVTGVVEKAGERAAGLKPGDRVGVPWMQYACGRCPACRSGAEMLCATGKSTGGTVHGGTAERVKAPAAFTHRIPEGLDLGDAAPLLCAGITVFSPLRRAGNLAGKTVAVAGIGGLGHLGIRMAAAMGAHVVAITRGGGKKDPAHELGAHAGIGGRGSWGIRMAAAMGAHVVAITRGGDKKDLAHELGAHAVIDSEKEKVRRRLRTIGGADLILLTGISARLFVA